MPQENSTPVALQPSPADWRRARRPRPIPKHDWQVELPPTRAVVARWRPLRLVGWFTLLAALCAGFLVVALDTPERTPLLIVTDLRPGLISQSPWLAEEVERLKLLDHTTLTVKEHAPSTSIGTAAAAFHQSLQGLAPAADRTGTVIIYLRLPGLVDDAGRPCLIPPQSSLVRPEEWLPVEGFLDQAAGDVFAEHVHRLVILDRCQPASVWQAGILADTFPDQLEMLIKRQHHAGRWQRLHVLTDTSGRQQGWESSALGGSVFGEAVWSALSGQANSTKSGGNGDRHVSLAEMTSFVTRRTSSWVWENRKQVQTPALFSSDPRDFHLFWAAPAGAQQKWQAEADRLRTPVERDAALHRMTQLWAARQALEEQTPWRFDPVAWQQLNRLLRHYERLTRGGASAARQREDVDRSIESLLTSMKNAVHAEDPLEHGEASLHHRQLARRLNVELPAECDFVSNALDQIRHRPTRSVARTLLDDLQRHGRVPQHWDLVVLRHLVKDAPDSSWSRSELIGRVLGVMVSLGRIQGGTDGVVSVMLEPQYQPVEAQLREILDHLFIGDDDHLETATDLVTAAEKQLAECEVSARELTRAIEQRDRAAAELPRLAEWIYAPGCGDTGPDAKHGVDDWVAATRSWKQIESALAQCRERGSSVDAATLAGSLATQLDREVSDLWSRVEDAYDRLLTGATDAKTVREMEHMLSTSLIPRQPDSLSRTPVEQRMSLHETWQQAATQLAIQFAAAKPEVQFQDIANTQSPDEWMMQIVRGAAPHPIFAMLALSDEKPPAPQVSMESLRAEILAQSRERSVRIRQALAEIPRELQRGQHVSFDSTDARERAWRTQAQKVRGAARWLTGDLPYNPCHRTEMADCGHLLRSRAACMVEDFWAGPQDGAAPFFVQAANDLLAAADLCDADWRSSLSAAGKADANQTLRTLATYQNQIKPELHVTAVAVPQILASDALQTEIEIRRQSRTLIPSGAAAVFLSRGDAAEEMTVIREAALLPEDSAATQDASVIRVRVQSPLPEYRTEERNACRAYAYFRGHRFADDFQLAPTEGFTVRTAPGATSPTTVTVQSTRRRPTAILFVLDASASMTDNVAREGTLGSIRKIDAAVEALTSLLNDMADENNVRVGVVFYGHRVASGENAAAGVLRQPLYQQRFPFSPMLQPFEDVETVLPVGRFGPAELGLMNDRLRNLRPWGETPLYLSILEGLEQLQTAPADATRTMVVITDGLNYQFKPTPEKQTQLDDVLRAVEGRDVAVHLLGFGIAEKQIEQAHDEFSRISAATGGTADVTVRDAARLQSRLRSLYQPGRFSIEGDRDFQRAAQVGDPIALSPKKPAGQEYAVRYESAAGRIALEGGEKLTFRPAEDGTLRIVSDVPYLSTSLRARDSGLNSPCDLVASRPMGKGSDLVVRWSLCQRDGQFTARPAIGYFWVQPLDEKGSEVGSAALCLGRATVPGQSLPTWEFQIPSWPRSAVTARLQGWVSSRPMTVDRTESYVSLFQRQQNNETWQALPIPAVRWQVRHDRRSVTLVERYDADAGDPQVWTDLTRNSAPQGSFNASQPATLLNVERRYDPKHRLFVQTWHFDREIGPEDLDQLQFQFTSLETMQSQSWITTDSLLLSTVPQALVIKPVPVMTR